MFGKNTQRAIETITFDIAQVEADIRKLDAEAQELREEFLLVDKEADSAFSAVGKDMAAAERKIRRLEEEVDDLSSKHSALLRAIGLTFGKVDEKFDELGEKLNMTRECIQAVAGGLEQSESVWDDGSAPVSENAKKHFSDESEGGGITRFPIQGILIGILNHLNLELDLEVEQDTGNALVLVSKKKPAKKAATKKAATKKE
jgi:SMC interacting uncharacterized protein involved in chromosome segregation